MASFHVTIPHLVLHTYLTIAGRSRAVSTSIHLAVRPMSCRKGLPLFLVEQGPAVNPEISQRLHDTLQSAHGIKSGERKTTLWARALEPLDTNENG